MNPGTFTDDNKRTYKLGSTTRGTSHSRDSDHPRHDGEAKLRQQNIISTPTGVGSVFGVAIFSRIRVRRLPASFTTAVVLAWFYWSRSSNHSSGGTGRYPRAFITAHVVALTITLLHPSDLPTPDPGLPSLEMTGKQY
jgi:hypothetical protein